MNPIFLVVTEVTFKVAPVGDIEMYNNWAGFVKNFARKDGGTISKQVDHSMSHYLKTNHFLW